MYQYSLYINSLPFHFESSECLHHFLCILFDHCNSRRDLYKDIISENTDMLMTLQSNLDVFHSRNELEKMKRVRNALKYLIDTYKEVYDPTDSISNTFNSLSYHLDTFVFND